MKTMTVGTKIMKSAAEAIRGMICKTEHGYDPTLLSMLLRLTGNEGIHVSAIVAMPMDKEQILPGEIPYCNEFGEKRDSSFPRFHFLLDETADIYHVFN